MKRIVIIGFIAIIGLASCGRRYTCPTYLKNDTDKNMRVQEVEKINKQKM
jgi:hypothetical protein